MAYLRARVHYIICMVAMLATFHTEASEYLFSTISLNEGLSQTTARAMLRDSHGYLWIGTKSGLNRYDSGRIKSYYSNPDDITSIPDNDISDVFEDAHDNVWIVTEKGVAVYDRSKDSFNRLECSGHLLKAKSHLLREDGVMFGGSGQLLFYKYADDAVNPLATHGGSNRFYTSIAEWDPGRYLLTTRWDGMWLYNESTGRIERLGICQSRDIMAAHIDSEGRLWVSPYGEGLICYDRAGHIVTRIDSHILGSDIVLDLLGAGDTLWVATDGGGLHTINAVTHEITPIQVPRDRRQRGLRSVIKLYRDNLGYIYAGTVRDGMTCIITSPMRTFTQRQGNALTVTSLLADGDKIWVGVDGGGIVQYLPENEDRFVQFPSTAGMKVTSIEHFDAAHLIFSTFDNGLFLFNKSTGSISKAPAIFSEISEANSKKALALDLLRLPDNRLAILSDRIYMVNLKDNTWEDVPSARVNNRLNEFYTDLRRMLCFTDGEIISFDINTHKVETLCTLPDRTIACAAFDGGRYIYIGSASGIKQLDTETGLLTPMTNATPLPQRVTSLLYDSGRMWIGAGGTVYIKNFNNGEFCKFDRYDGVEPNEFIYKSKLATPTRMYLGGVNGLLKIDRTEIPEYVARKQNAVDVHATDVDADGVMLASLNADDTYEIPFDHSNVTIRVDGGDTHPLRQSPFRFFINSPDGEAPIETSDNTFTINKLPAGGRFDIYAQAVAPDGSWSSPRRVAILKVKRPWWSTGWARAIYIIALASLIAIALAIFVRRRRAAAEKKMAELERQSLEKEVGFLTDMNHELRAPLTIIYARLKSLMESMRTSSIKDPVVENEIDSIYQSTRRMRDIINTTVDQWVVPEVVPDSQAPEVNETEPKASTDSSPIDTSEMTVIIAEEDTELSNYIAENLKKVFGRVIIANDGKAALADVKNSSPDLIITDAKLAGMNGTELCHHIKQLEEYSHIPIIMLTTRIEDMNLRGGHDLGADIYITKPFDLSQLLSRCRMVLRSFNRVKQRYIGKAADILPRDNFNNEEESFLLKIKDVIERNIGHPGFGIDIIVEKMLMSRSSLYNKFRELTGQSLGTYIEEYRLARAKEMLSSSNMNMSEISDALGFSTQRYFSTFFRKKTGISPTQYRSENQIDTTKDPNTDTQE